MELSSDFTTFRVSDDSAFSSQAVDDFMNAPAAKETPTKDNNMKWLISNLGSSVRNAKVPDSINLAYLLVE